MAGAASTPENEWNTVYLTGRWPCCARRATRSLTRTSRACRRTHGGTLVSTVITRSGYLTLAVVGGRWRPLRDRDQRDPDETRLIADLASSAVHKARPAVTGGQGLSQ